jgi:hypothetical protein
MRRFLIVVLTLAMMLSSAQVGHAQKQGCSDAAARRALDEAVTLRTWDTLYTSFKAYRQCDDGAIAEGYSESVARILVDHWKTLPELNRIAQKDAQFRHFVLRHLDATLNMDDVEKVKRKAMTQCPSGLNRLCSDLVKQSDSAMHE